MPNDFNLFRDWETSQFVVKEAYYFNSEASAHITGSIKSPQGGSATPMQKLLKTCEKFCT
jgi:hypothetical protein